MAALPCKMIAQVSCKAGADVFHQIIANKPEHLMNVTPGKFQGLDLHQGDPGTHGAVHLWKYTLDGKEGTCKTMLQDIDEKKKQVSFKHIEGDILKQYNNFIVTFHVETKGGVDFITWTIDYELLNSDSPHPVAYLNHCIDFTQEMETHIFG